MMNIEDLQILCKKLPRVTEDIKWGHDLCFSVGNKMFCVAGLDGELMISFKVMPAEFEVLCSRPGIIPAPYMAQHNWIRVTPSSLSARELEFQIRQSYELVREKLPRKIKKDLFGG